MTSDQVLTKGALRAGAQLGLAHAELAQVLDLDAQAISAMEAGIELTLPLFGGVLTHGSRGLFALCLVPALFVLHRAEVAQR